jgi:hypothetical protein
MIRVRSFQRVAGKEEESGVGRLREERGGRIQRCISAEKIEVAHRRSRKQSPSTSNNDLDSVGARTSSVRLRCCAYSTWEFNGNSTALGGADLRQALLSSNAAARYVRRFFLLPSLLWSIRLANITVIDRPNGQFQIKSSTPYSRNAVIIREFSSQAAYGPVPKKLKIRPP